jgi:hypothetical protein
VHECVIRCGLPSVQESVLIITTYHSYPCSAAICTHPAPTHATPNKLFRCLQSGAYNIGSVMTSDFPYPPPFLFAGLDAAAALSVMSHLAAMAGLPAPLSPAQPEGAGIASPSAGTAPAAVHQGAQVAVDTRALAAQASLGSHGGDAGPPCAVIASIHQPRAAVWAMFDRVRW